MSNMYIKELAFVALLWVCLQIKTVRAQCGGYRSLWYNHKLTVSNDGYPSYYEPHTYCKWEIESPQDSLLVISCPDISIPSFDNFYFYRTGRRAETIVDKKGYSALHEIWPSYLLSIELPLTDGSGRFSCEIQVLATGTTTTTTTTPPPQPKCDCGWRYQRRITGGVETGINEFPFMAGLASYNTRSIICGGAIISEWFVVTAAHCVEGTYFGTLYVVVGEHNVDTGSDTSATELYIIENVHAHPGYNKVTFENDIAIIQTTNPIKFSPAVGPACLPINFNEIDGFYDVTALGWGSVGFSDPTSPYLQKVVLRSVSNGECSLKMPNTIYSSQMCVYGDGKDTCTYDSGGPLIWLDQTTNRFKLLGLVSYGLGCGSSLPSVNTRVKSYTEFLVLYTGNNTGKGFCIL